MRTALLAASLTVLALGAAAAEPATADDARRLREARALLDRDQLDQAQPMLVDLFTRAPASDLAGTAASLLLDGLDRAGRTDELERWIVDLHGRAPLLAAHADLAVTVERLFAAVHRLRAERLTAAAGRANDPAAFVACGQAYLAAAALPGADRIDELLYNGAVCFTAGAAASPAGAALDELVRRFPSSALAPRASVRLAELQVQRGDRRAAASTLERLAGRWPATREAEDALWNALVLRIELGDLREAEVDADAGARLWGKKRLDWSVKATLAVARARLDRDRTGDRSAARRAATRLLRGDDLRRLPAGELLAAARTLWDAACPDRPLDGLCVSARALRDGRDRALAAAAHGLAAQLAEHPDPTIAIGARLLVADEQLERVARLPALSPRTGDVARDAWFVRLATAGDEAARALTRAAEADPAAATKVAIEARRGQLADTLDARTREAVAVLARAHRVPGRDLPDHAAVALDAYRRCQVQATAAALAGTWLAVCDRGAHAHGDPLPTRPVAPPAPAPLPWSPPAPSPPPPPPIPAAPTRP